MLVYAAMMLCGSQAARVTGFELEPARVEVSVGLITSACQKLLPHLQTAVGQEVFFPNYNADLPTVRLLNVEEVPSPRQAHHHKHKCSTQICLVFKHCEVSLHPTLAGRAK